MSAAPAPEPASLPPPPNKPEDYECCHRGCCPCIFDYYWNALTRWEVIMRAAGRDPDEVLAELGVSR